MKLRLSPLAGVESTKELTGKIIELPGVPQIGSVIGISGFKHSYEVTRVFYQIGSDGVLYSIYVQIKEWN
jgi:hypothetical protein